MPQPFFSNVPAEMCLIHSEIYAAIIYQMMMSLRQGVKKREVALLSKWLGCEFNFRGNLHMKWSLFIVFCLPKEQEECAR